MTWTMFTVCVVGIGVMASEQAGSSAARFETSDQHLRSMAIASPVPEYPKASLAKKVSGVVVAAVVFNEKGTNEVIDIVQSPDVETGRAVREAVTQWTIRPSAMRIAATLAFYFQPKGQSGAILTPAEMRALISPAAKNVEREDEPPLKQITAAEFKALPSQPATVLLDIRDRETFREGHEKGAVNIPFKEVLLRAPAELPVSRHVVIDCRDPLDFCAIAVHWLASNGFGRVSVLRR